VLGIAGALALRRMFGSWLAPAPLLMSAWTVTLTVASLRVDFQPRYAVFNVGVHLSTYLFVVGSIAMFTVGAVYADTVLRRRTRSVASPRRDDWRLKYSPSRLRVITYAAFAGGFAVFTFNALRA